MALTKSDLSSIRNVVRDEVKGQLKPVKSDISQIKKDVKKLDKKFIELFDFLDKDWSKLHKRVDYPDRIEDVDTRKIVNS